MGMVFSMASTAKDTLTEIIEFNKERREREAEEKAQRELEVQIVVLDAWNDQKCANASTCLLIFEKYTQKKSTRLKKSVRREPESQWICSQHGRLPLTQRWPRRSGSRRVLESWNPRTLSQQVKKERALLIFFTYCASDIFWLGHFMLYGQNVDVVH